MRNKFPSHFAEGHEKPAWKANVSSGLENERTMWPTCWHRKHRKTLTTREEPKSRRVEAEPDKGAERRLRLNKSSSITSQESKDYWPEVEERPHHKLTYQTDDSSSTSDDGGPGMYQLSMEMRAEIDKRHEKFVPHTKPLMEISKSDLVI